MNEHPYATLDQNAAQDNLTPPPPPPVTLHVGLDPVIAEMRALMMLHRIDPYTGEEGKNAVTLDSWHKKLEFLQLQLGAPDLLKLALQSIQGPAADYVLL